MVLLLLSIFFLSHLVEKLLNELFLPSSSQEIPEMGNAAIYSLVSSTGQEMSEKVLLETQRLF